MGQSPVMAMLVLAAIATVAGIVVTGTLAVATSQKGQALHGADAAALAGAQAVLDGLPDDLAPGFTAPSEIPGWIGGGSCLQTGSGEAARLAAENGDRLTSYCYDVWSDEVTVAVSGDDGARARATAATSFDATTCRLDQGFTPPPDPPADEDDDDGDGDDGDDNGDDTGDDEPPAPVRTTLDCGTGDLTVVFDPATSRFRFVALAAELSDVRPRLTR